MHARSVDVEEFVRRRVTLGLTVEDLAKKAGVSRSTITYICAQHHTPRSSTIGKLALALGCSIDDISIPEQRDSEAA